MNCLPKETMLPAEKPSGEPREPDRRPDVEPARSADRVEEPAGYGYGV